MYCSDIKKWGKSILTFIVNVFFGHDEWVKSIAYVLFGHGELVKSILTFIVYVLYVHDELVKSILTFIVNVLYRYADCGDDLRLTKTIMYCTDMQIVKN